MTSKESGKKKGETTNSGGVLWASKKEGMQEMCQDKRWEKLLHKQKKGELMVRKERQERHLTFG